MKLRKLFIPAFALTLIGLLIKICDTVFNVNGSGFFLSSDVCNAVVACAFILLFVLGLVLSFMDRKKHFVSEPGKDMVCGIFGFIASVLIIGNGVVRLLSLNGANIVENVLAIAAGFILLYESCISFTGSNGMKKIPVAALIVPIWSCVRFVSIFVDYTTKSLKAVELFDIISVAFLMMFLYYQAMYFAGINNRLSVRRATVYGSIFIMLGIISSVDLFIKMYMGTKEVTNVDTQIVMPTITNFLTFAGDIVLCIYAFLLIRGMLAGAEATLGTVPAAEMQEGEASADTVAEGGPADAQTGEDADASAGAETGDDTADGSDGGENAD